MAELMLGDYDDALHADVELKPAKTSNKDAKNKMKVEARRRIDDLLEQKRLRQMLDMDDDDALGNDWIN